LVANGSKKYLKRFAKNETDIKDLLATATEHIAQIIANDFNKIK